MGILVKDGIVSFNISHIGHHPIQPALSVRIDLEVPSFSCSVTAGTTRPPLPLPAPTSLKIIKLLSCGVQVSQDTW